MLEDFTEDKALVERITLLTSFEVGKEFHKLCFRTTKLDVFRTTPPQVMTPSAIASRQEGPKWESPQTVAPKTWAALTKSNKDAGLSSTPMETGSTSDRVVWVNARGDRIDTQFPRLPKSAIDSWDHKIKKANMRYCRSFHLNGLCQGNCGFSHGPLSLEEKLVFRAELRQGVCKKKLKCRDRYCCFGHNCSCSKFGCKFKEMHGVDRSTAEVWNE